MILKNSNHLADLTLLSKENNLRKAQVGAIIYKTIADDVKLFAKSVFLAGGGAASFYGCGRKINDLDFHIEVTSPNFTFDKKDPMARKFLKHVNSNLREQFGNGFTGLAPSVNPINKEKILIGYCCGVEVNIGISNIKYFNSDKYPVLNVKLPGGNSAPLKIESPEDLVLDKTYSYVYREKYSKQLTDLVDLTAAFSKCRDKKILIKYLNQYRGLDYNQQRAEKKKFNMDKSLYEQFRKSLASFLQTKEKHDHVKKQLERSLGTKTAHKLLISLEILRKEINLDYMKFKDNYQNIQYKNSSLSKDEKRILLKVFSYVADKKPVNKLFDLMSILKDYSKIKGIEVIVNNLNNEFDNHYKKNKKILMKKDLLSEFKYQVNSFTKQISLNKKTMDLLKRDIGKDGYSKFVEQIKEFNHELTLCTERNRGFISYLFRN